MRKLAVLLVLVVAVALGAPAQAITNGVPDDERHPYVGQLFFYRPHEIDPRFTDPGAWFNCTGTLISPRIVLTAGHCTYGIGKNGTSTVDAENGVGGNDTWISFAEVPDYDGLPPSTDYIPDRNEERYEDREEWLNDNPEWHRGTAYPHPRYDDSLFFHYDLGVVVLHEPVSMPRYGELPELGYLDRFMRMEKSARRFTVVGFGLEKVLPKLSEGGDRRMRATVKLNTLNGTGDAPRGSFAVFSNNPGRPHRGGTCFGDSGGPIFDAGTRIIVAVTSFGQSPNCTGIGGGYRVDQADDLTWLATRFGVEP